MDERATRTLRRVREALEAGEVAGVPEVIRLIQELSAKAFSITVKELADIISRDVTVTAKVISAANTVGYNPWAIPIGTVSEAIQVIGFERVRNLAISLLLAENAERTHSEEQREVAALALQSGFLAQELCEQEGSGLNPEQAFICASLRNYGKLIMTTFLLPEYREARELEAELGVDEAFHEVVGLTPLELGYHLLLSRNLPPTILLALQDVSRERIDELASKGGVDFRYLATADFSVRLSELAIDPNLDAGRFELAAEKLSKRFEKWIHLPAEGVPGLLRNAGAQLKNLQRGLGLHTLSAHVMDSISHRVEGRDLPPRPPRPRPVGDLTAPATPAGPGPPAETGQLAEAGAPQEAVAEAPPPARDEQSVILNAIDELTRQISDQKVSFRQALGLLFRTVHRHLGSTDTILFLRDRELRAFRPRLGTGPIFPAIEATVKIDSRVRDVFGISLSRLEDVSVENATDPKIVRFLPPWLKRNPPLRSFVILPLQQNGKAYGFVWSGCTGPRQGSVTTETLRQLRALRTHVTTVRRLESEDDGKDPTPPLKR